MIQLYAANIIFLVKENKFRLLFHLQFSFVFELSSYHIINWIFPGTTNIHQNKNTNASSFIAKTSLAWITKNAITIVKIIGIIANLYKKPIIKAIEHANSAKTANPKERGEPSPNGSGKDVESSWKLLHFCIPWFINNRPNEILRINKNRDAPALSGFRGNKNL